MTRFFITLFVISILVRFVLPVVLRWLLKAFVQKQAQRYGMPNFGQPPFSQPVPPTDSAPGEVHVAYVPPKAPSKRKQEFKGGEYVDFEEVK